MSKDISLINLGDILQMGANISSSLAILVSAIIFTYQKKRELKIQAIKVGMSIEQIVGQLSYVDMVLKGSFPIEYKMLYQKSADLMVKFEKAEIDLVYSEHEVKIIKKMFCDNKFNSVMIGSPSLIFKVKKDAVDNANKKFSKIVSEIVGQNNIQEYTHMFHRILIDTLNKIETLSAMMELGVADEHTVFSLWDSSFCDFIKVMHYYIASTNPTSNIGEKKLYYTTAIFNKWKRRILKSKRKLGRN